MLKPSQRFSPDESQDKPVPIYAPSPHLHNSVDSWLQAWVQFRVEEAGDRAFLINGKQALGLLGSIGFDSAVDSSGQFWIWTEEVEKDVEDTNWRAASDSERTWITVCVQRRRFPEFAVLQQLRPISATTCLACNGTGFIFGNSVICSTCSALGWTTLPP